MKVLAFFIFFVTLLIISPTEIIAKDKSQFITIVNPVRISRYTEDPKESVVSEYAVVLENNLAATWLLTYDAILDSGVYSAVQPFDDKQELGIFLEITKSVAEASGVEYHNTGHWHHATSVFLSGYTQEERIKMIDIVFEKFKERFGYYPTSVGSWWTDSYSLDYMKEKYNITANLGCADQFATDGYQIWGQPWSAPFYPSRFHAAVPATNKEVKLDIVTIQWAPRDPLNGYKNSAYSTQDYLITKEGLKTEYFKKLLSLYAKRGSNEFGQVTVGLEADLSPQSYSKEYANQLKAVKELIDQGEVEALTMNDFASFYQEKFPELSPAYSIVTDDLLGSDIKVIWHSTPRYRIGLTYDPTTNEIKIFDYRSYHQDFQEPYYSNPNKQFTLSVNIPSFIDAITDEKNIWKINLSDFDSFQRSAQSANVKFEKGEIVLFEDKIIINGQGVHVPDSVRNAKVLSVDSSDDRVEITSSSSWIVGREGYLFDDLDPETTHRLKSRKLILAVIVAFVLYLLAIVVVLRSPINLLIKLPVFMFLLFALAGLFYLGQSWYNSKKITYFVSQAEVDVLNKLLLLPPGKVLLYDKECLQCSWQGKARPAVFANKRSYVKDIGKHAIVYNFSVFEAKSQKEARQEFDKLRAKYIYLVKYRDYFENIPFSPGDLNIEKVYANANAELWRVKN